MATTYKHTSGAVTAAKRVTATDVFTRNADGAIIEVDQPAGTILSEVIVRFTKTSAHAASSEAGYEIGAVTSGSNIASNPDGFLDAGTTIPANAVFYLNSGRSAAGWAGDSQHDASVASAASAYTDSDRTIYLTFLHSDHAVTTNTDAEVNFVFTHLI